MPSVRIQSTCTATQLPIGATQTEWGPPPVCQATKSPPQNTQKTPDTQLFICQADPADRATESVIERARASSRKDRSSQEDVLPSKAPKQLQAQDGAFHYILQ